MHGGFVHPGVKQYDTLLNALSGSSIFHIGILDGAPDSRDPKILTSCSMAKQSTTRQTFRRAVPFSSSNGVPISTITGLMSEREWQRRSGLSNSFMGSQYYE